MFVLSAYEDLLPENQNNPEGYTTVGNYYSAYFVVFAKSRFKKFYFVAKSRPKKFAIHNQSPLKKFTICDMLCAKLGKRFGGSRDVKTKNRKAFD